MYLEWNRSRSHRQSDRAMRRKTASLRRPPAACPLFYPCEIAVPSEPAAEAGCPGHAVFDQRLASVVPLLDQGLAHRQTMTLDRRSSISAHTDLWKPCNLLRQLLRLRPCSPFLGDIFAQADVQTFLRRNLASRENDLEC